MVESSAIPHITQCTACNENFLPSKQLLHYWCPDRKAPWVIHVLNFAYMNRKQDFRS